MDAIWEQANPQLRDLAPYEPGKPIEETARECGLRPEQIIKLASNENPLGPSPAALAAVEKALRSLHLYPDGNAFYLKQRLAEKFAIEPAQIILGNGSNEIIEFVGHALMEPGSEVVVSQYCFAIYPIVARMFGAELVTVPARGYGHDLPEMARAITPRTRVVFVANPNNPTGTLAPAADVMRLLTELPPEVLLVMDEAYLEFVDEPADLLPLVREGKTPNLLLMRTFSKIYGLAGLRVGYGLGPRELVGALEKVRQPFNINSLAQAAALAALDDQEHLQRTRQNNTRGLEFFRRELRALGLEFIPSSANFICARVGDGQRVFDALQRRGIIVRPMAGYQLPEWIRISIGTPAENQRCLEAMREVLEKGFGEGSKDRGGLC
jgi:histidinol-phosphate aminotransferase